MELRKIGPGAVNDCICEEWDMVQGKGVIIIIFIDYNWVGTRWQWLFYMYTKHEIG